MHYEVSAISTSNTRLVRNSILNFPSKVWTWFCGFIICAVLLNILLAKIYLALKCVKSLDLLGIYIHVCWDCSKLKKSSCITTRDIEEIERKEKKNFCFTNPTKKQLKKLFDFILEQDFLSIFIYWYCSELRSVGEIVSCPPTYSISITAVKQAAICRWTWEKGRQGKKKKKNQRKRGLVTFFQTIFSACVFLFKCVRFYCHIN